MIGRWMLAAAMLCITGTALALGGNSDDGNKSGPLAAIETKIDAGEYGDALTELEIYIEGNPTSADAFNWLGYANRKLGRLELAGEAYARALLLDPDHKGAHEYAGELRLMLGDLEGANEHLAELDRICLLGCEEYDELKAEITAWKKANDR
ncbi:MAG: tetratricopeptide repeat protein [Alphaproteobacteria bacterium]|nr:tetratricopeptide repeat protein [Alphaproteobacteria bacterium]MCY4231462.1 tetratricopeptide repeat protein [Alphaproteobacteria bacterium]MCY4318709.1 tetratricopeptide repeat protein [Alphaproteobacteria bacterium]